MTLLDLRERLRDHAPLVLFPAFSLALAAGASLRMGFERRSRTTYCPLQGVVAALDAANGAAAAGAQSAVRHDALNLVSDAVRKEYSPVEADELLARLDVAGPPAPRRHPASTSRRGGRAALRRSPVPSASDDAGVQTLASQAPKTAAGDTLESVSDAYENDQARYALDASAVADGVSLRLIGLAHVGDRCILKVAVTNRGSDDFFVRELSLRAGREPLAAKSFLRLFVEAGRSREGYVVFDKPRSGVDVHAALKEDRENGRVIETPVPYPF